MHVHAYTQREALFGDRIGQEGKLMGREIEMVPQHPILSSSAWEGREPL